MTETDAYLNRLRTELVGVPPEVSREIIAGIREELAGLDAHAAAARIEELGDPAFIAAEARAGIADPDAPAPVAPPAPSDSRTYVIITSLLVALGGIVVPIIGWLAGLIMMWLSKSWLRWEKWVATLAVSVVVLLVFLPMRVFSLPLPHWGLLAGLWLVPLISGFWLMARGLGRARH